MSSTYHTVSSSTSTAWSYAETYVSKAIEENPDVMDGQPVIKGTRLTVEYIYGLLAGGYGIDDIMNEYKDLPRWKIEACIYYYENVMHPEEE